MSRKLFSVFALLIVFSMVLAACGGGAAPAPAGEEAAAEPAAEEAAAAEPGETEGPAPAAAGDTLATVQARGHVICGGNQSVPGFGYLDTEGFSVQRGYELRPLFIGQVLSAVEYLREGLYRG